MSLLRTALAEERHEPVPGGEPPHATDLLERLVDRNMALRGLLIRLLDPEDLGHAVGAEVRALVRETLRSRP